MSIVLKNLISSVVVRFKTLKGYFLPQLQVPQPRLLISRGPADTLPTVRVDLTFPREIPLDVSKRRRIARTEVRIVVELLFVMQRYYL